MRIKQQHQCCALQLWGKDRGQKSWKFCRRLKWMVPYLIAVKQTKNIGVQANKNARFWISIKCNDVKKILLKFWKTSHQIYITSLVFIQVSPKSNDGDLLVEYKILVQRPKVRIFLSLIHMYILLPPAKRANIYINQKIHMYLY